MFEYLFNVQSVVAITDNMLCLSYIILYLTTFKILLPGITLKQNVFEIEKVQEIVLELHERG